MNENNLFAEDRIDNIEEMEESGREQYNYNYDVELDISEFINKFENQEEITDESTWVLAGRIVRDNEFGSFRFYDIDDGTGKVQIMCRNNEVTDYDLLDNIDSYDHVLFKGTAGFSNTGELTLNAQEFSIVAKSLNHFPSNRDDLSSKHTIVQRTPSLASDKQLFDSVETRFKIINLIRDYLTDEGFQEVDTPILHNHSGGAEATSFDTECNAINREMALRIAPELYLKRLITSGYKNIFEIAKCFRNEDIDTTHNPEFTMLELYQVYSNYEDMMEITENMIGNIVISITDNETSVEYQGETIDFSTPWNRYTFNEAIEKYTQFTIQDTTKQKLIYYIESKYDVELENNSTKDDVLMELFDLEVESNIIQPTFITKYPTSSTPLCKTCSDDEDRVERFEAIVCGIEIANAYTELTDPRQQLERFKAQANVDEDINVPFVKAISYGMPPTAGLGLGIDRIAMLLTNSESIKSVIPYPITTKRI